MGMLAPSKFYVALDCCEVHYGTQGCKINCSEGVFRWYTPLPSPHPNSRGQPWLHCGTTLPSTLHSSSLYPSKIQPSLETLHQHRSSINFIEASTTYLYCLTEPFPIPHTLRAEVVAQIIFLPLSPTTMPSIPTPGHSAGRVSVPDIVLSGLYTLIHFTLIATIGIKYDEHHITLTLCTLHTDEEAGHIELHQMSKTHS